MLFFLLDLPCWDFYKHAYVMRSLLLLMGITLTPVLLFL